MDFEKKVPEWKAAGVEPSESLKTDGFQAGYKPPASFFNWFWSGVSACLTEIRTKLAGHAEAKNNPHGVTAAQVGLDKVNNTSDTEKYVKYAQTAGKADKVGYALTVRLNGGRTEGTDSFTFDGSTSRTVNITPAKIGAAEAIAGIPIVNATSDDGVTYTATVAGVTELTNGMLVTIIPNMTSTTTAPKLNLNSLGAKPMRLSLSTNSAILVQSDSEGYYVANRPITMQFDTGYLPSGAWKTYSKQRPSASDLYGDFNLEQLGDVVIADEAPTYPSDGKWYLIKAEV